MGELIQQILLSDVMIIFLTGVIALGITIRALSQREYAGYILGWLMGVFLVLLLSALIPDASTVAEAVPAQTADQGFNFLAILLPGIIGLGTGVGIAALIYRGNQAESARLRALIVGIVFSLTLAIGYVMLMLSASGRLTMGVFVLTAAIGALVHFIVVSRGMYSIATDVSIAQPVVIPPISAQSVTEASPIPVGVQVPAQDNSAANRIQAIRQQFDARFAAAQPPVEPQPPLPPGYER